MSRRHPSPATTEDTLSKYIEALFHQILEALQKNDVATIYSDEKWSSASGHCAVMVSQSGEEAQKATLQVMVKHIILSYILFIKSFYILLQVVCWLYHRSDY